MSSTGRGAERVDFDAYPTPQWAVHRLLEAYQPPGGAWLEPAAGSGEIIRAVNEVRSDVVWHANELRAECRADLASLTPNVAIDNFLAGEAGPRRYALCITNPPYSDALKFLRRGLEVAHVVALLLRSNFLGSQERAPFFREHMPDRYQLPNRPCFVHRERFNEKKNRWTRTSSDSCEYEWMVFYPCPRDVGTSRILALTPEAVVAAAKRRAPVIREDSEGRIVSVGAAA